MASGGRLATEAGVSGALDLRLLRAQGRLLAAPAASLLEPGNATLVCVEAGESAVARDSLGSSISPENAFFKLAAPAACQPLISCQ
jgi:hypothetical protein